MFELENQDLITILTKLASILEEIVDKKGNKLLKKVYITAKMAVQIPADKFPCCDISTGKNDPDFNVTKNSQHTVELVIRTYSKQGYAELHTIENGIEDELLKPVNHNLQGTCMKFTKIGSDPPRPFLKTIPFMDTLCEVMYRRKYQ